MQKNIPILLLVLFIYSCKNKDIKTTYQKGNFTVVSTKIPDTQDSLRGYYDKSGHIINWEIFTQKGAHWSTVYYFSAKGDIDSLVSYFDSIRNNWAINFDKNAAVKSINKYKGNFLTFGLTFRKENNYWQYFPESLIKKATPFVTVDPDADTITLGETYSARIVLNFPLKKRKCEIKYRNNLKSEFVHLADGPEANLTETPTDTGEHRYEIFVGQILSTIGKPVAEGIRIPQFFDEVTVKYYVKPKN